MATDFDPAEFRRVISHLPSGVTIVTAADDTGARVGFTASSVTSLSLEPPMLLVCVDRRSDSLAVLRSAQAFAVHVLAADESGLALRFAQSPAETRFDGVEHETRATGAPILRAGIAWLDCRLEKEFEGGDHSILIGRVVEAGTEERAPLIYWRGRFDERPGAPGPA